MELDLFLENDGIIFIYKIFINKMFSYKILVWVMLKPLSSGLMAMTKVNGRRLPGFDGDNQHLLRRCS
jgi:hypothetical protein